MIYRENNKLIPKRGYRGKHGKNNFSKENLIKGVKEYSILTISLVLVVVGYVSYLSKYQKTNEASSEADKVADIGDATLVDSKDISKNDSSVEEDELRKKEEAVANKDKVENEKSEKEAENIETNAKPETDEYFISSRLERENMYSQTIETYQKILENSNCSVEQRNEASDKINEINKTKNSIMIAENLIKTKGFEDCIVFVNSDSVSIVIKKKELSNEDIAKIQNIAARELAEKIENIHISNKY